jgi:cytochrome c-type biogenesis protein CcmH/NrfF
MNGRADKYFVRIAGLLLAAVLLMGAGDDAARFKDLGHRMMCPCSCSQMLLECNHVGCKYSTRMRADLKIAVDGGHSDDAILQEFAENWGVTVLAAPRSTGFDRVAWIMPYALLVFGIGLAIMMVRSWSKRPPAQATSPDIGTDTNLNFFRERARKETQL